MLPVYLSYLIKMTVVSAVLLGYYWLFLRNASFHVFNRYYLLGSTVIALQAPLWSIPFFTSWSAPIDHATFRFTLPKATLVRDTPTSFQTTYPGFWNSLLQHPAYIYMIYAAVALLFLWPLFRSLFLIHRLKHRYTPQRVAEICVYSTYEAGTPFSWFRHLFWNEAISTDTEKGRVIFRHELYHIRQLHTLDLLALETIRGVFWFNPFFYLILRELKLVHEFLADRYALEPNALTTSPAANLAAKTPPEPPPDRRAAYAEWLVWQSQNVSELPAIVNTFYHTQLKRRITMILKPTTRAGYATRALTLPLALLLFCAFAARDSRHEKYKLNNDNEPFLQNTQLMRFYIHNTRYPQIALEKGWEGTIGFSVTIDADGREKDFDGITAEPNTENGKIPTMTITARALNPQQQVSGPPADTAKDIFVREMGDVTHLLFDHPVTNCPPGKYFFAVAFKIEKP